MRRHANALVAALTLLICLGVAQAVADSPPKVTISDPSSIAYDSAELSGTINPEGGPSPTLWSFEYTTTPSEPETWQRVGEFHEFSGPEAEETMPIPVKEGLGGLLPATEYAVRLVATNGSGDNQIRSAVKAFTTDSVSPPQAAMATITTFSATSAHFEGTVNSGGNGVGETTTWRFECSPECPSAEETNPLELSDGSNQTVKTDATELQPGTSYAVTLVATNAGGFASSTETFMTEVAAPSIDPIAHTSKVTQTSAILHAIVNTNGAATSYHFEFGPDTSYGFSIPIPDDVVSAGSEPVEVSQSISGLQPDTSYHYRVIASNDVDTATGSDHTFRTYPMTQPTPLGPFPGQGFLPDNRAWELVSPMDKNGGDVLINPARTRSSTDGNAVGFGSQSGFANVAGTSVSVDYIAKRGETGWITHAITPQQESANGTLVITGPGDAIYEGLSDDLSRGIVRANPLPSLDPKVATVQNLFLREDLLSPGLGSYQLLTTSFAPIPIQRPGPGFTPVGYKPIFVAASQNLTHVLFESTRNLIPDASGVGTKLYEWTNSSLGLVGVLPDDEGGQIAMDAVAGDGRASLQSAGYQSNVMSEDGSRIVFSVPSSGQLYMRENGTHTVRVNASEKSNPEPQPTDALLQAVTPDGSAIFFTSDEPLTDDDDNQATDLYRYSAVARPDGGHLSRVSVDSEGLDGTAASVSGVMGASNDGSKVYFVARGQLVAGALMPRFSSIPLLYLWDEGSLTYIGQLNISGIDEAENFSFDGAAFTPKSSRVSPSGRYLLFSSYGSEDLTGYDHGKCEFHSATEPTCRELYVFDAGVSKGSGELACASCAPDGSPGRSDASLTLGAGGGASRTTTYLGHPLSDNGHWTFFSTGQSLVPRDSNNSYDVYSYDVWSGKVALLSSGASDAEDSYYLDASPDGSDVFFATREQLAGWDTDSSYDVYDARVGGGLPEPPRREESCFSDDCRAVSIPATPKAALGSTGAISGGNVKVRRHKCKKPQRGHQKRHKPRCRGFRRSADHKGGVDR